ncbi:LysE/ArgO family amino acid transporter [Halomonas korlensis]|uniref:L-lysine exporter family protein LysE/ArgO n=1 Tax=Halomonas korlensis TaxID=463301 RepID=A0A1I7H9H2_9GAMM|nr:LysE family transporter [Halomonas korlensis]SFU57381.1 L-lysine exporter family protein LysE/ArgO [Halomonas korlensis]
MLESFITGFFVSGGIIVAIGAQNAYVLGQAVHRQHHWWSAGLCMSSDVLLLSAGMFGVGALLLTAPEVMNVLRWLGVAFLAWLAGQALIRAARGRTGLDAAKGGRTRRQVLLATLAVTVLNPQVYLDTLLLIPSVGAQQESAGLFLAGAAGASVSWFALLAWGGAALAPWLSRPLAWRAIDGVIGVMLAAIAVQLAVQPPLA